MRATRLLVLIALLAGGLVACLPATKVCAAGPSLRVDLRFLVLGTDPEAPALLAWQSALRREGVPFDVLLLPAARLTRDALVAGPGHARYQAVVHAAPEGPVPLDQEQQRVLDAFLDGFSLREVIAFGAPPGTVKGALRDLSSTTLDVTAAGRPWMDGVRRVTVEGAFGYSPRPLTGGQALVTDARGGAVVASQRVGAHDELYVAVQSGPDLLHFQLLSHGLINWAANGPRLGLRRFHLAIQVDDVFLPNFRWDVDSNTTDFEDQEGVILMTPEDVEATAAWSARNGLRLDMVANYGGKAFRDLRPAFLEHEEAFGWVNHTYTHLNFDDATLQEMRQQVQRNARCADDLGLELDEPTELVTGEHSGLDNPALPEVLEQAGIDYIAADASRRRELFRLGPATGVPRHPVDLYYDVGTREEQLDQYNHAYLETCTGAFCLKAPVSWQDYLDRVSLQILKLIATNDPRTLYLHQSNLAEDRLLLQVLDEVLRDYRAMVDAPLVQPTLTESGQELQRQKQWTEATSDGSTVAYRQGGRVIVESEQPREVPLTGVQTGGASSGWVPVEAGKPLTVPSAPRGG